MSTSHLHLDENKRSKAEFLTFPPSHLRPISQDRPPFFSSLTLYGQPSARPGPDYFSAPPVLNAMLRRGSGVFDHGGDAKCPALHPPEGTPKHIRATVQVMVTIIAHLNCSNYLLSASRPPPFPPQSAAHPLRIAPKSPLTAKTLQSLPVHLR